MTYKDITLKVEANSGGIVHDIVHECFKLSNQLSIFVETEINGFAVLASPYDSEEKTQKEYLEYINNKTK